MRKLVPPSTGKRKPLKSKNDEDSDNMKHFYAINRIGINEHRHDQVLYRLAREFGYPGSVEFLRREI